MTIKSSFSKLLAFILIVVISLTGCTSATGLTGDYSKDTLTVVQNLSTAIELPQDAENKKEAQNLARKQINDYISFYRRDNSYGGLKSFTTMQTALNSLAGYYTSYGNRPLPEKLQQRLLDEFQQVEIALKRGF